jgi:hypothetical protein
MIDIVIPLGVGSVGGRDDELRLCLRSIEKYAQGIRWVWVIGHKPFWFVSTERYRHAAVEEFPATREGRSSRKVRWAFESLPLTNTIALWADDYVMTRPMDVSQARNYSNGDLHFERDCRWAVTRERTKEALHAAGYTTKNYELHFPIWFEREKYLSLGGWIDGDYHIRSVYGNMFCADCTKKRPDLKIHEPTRQRMGFAFRKFGLFSYDDHAVECGIISQIAKRLPAGGEFDNGISDD